MGPLRRRRAAAVGTLPGRWAAAAPCLIDVDCFGDSLTDTGDTQALFAGFGCAVPNPTGGPDAGGRFSNGPVWTGFPATGLGLAGAA